MTNYFIRLTPLDYYFFGGRRTFGSDNANYFVRSRLFPQQSALIGLMRYQMLQNGVPQTAIGESFDASNTSKQTFGALQSVSPTFLYCDPENKPAWDIEKCFWRHPLNTHLKKDGKPDKSTGQYKSEDLIAFNFSNSSNAQVLSGQGETAEWRTAAVVENYNAKKELADQLFVNTQNQVLSGKHIFPNVTRVGITKKARSLNGEKERGFYKQQVYKLRDDWAFALIAEFDPSFDASQLDGSITTFGGERSLFKIQVLEIAQSWESLNAVFGQHLFASEGGKTLTLLSDAFLPENSYKECSAVISLALDFQNIRTPKGNHVNYSSLGEKNQGTQLYKSRQYQLLQKGSVFYGSSEEINQIQKILKDQVQFRGIGYNHFVIR